MKLSRVLIAVTFMGILAMATHVSIDSDTWWHLRAGQYMVENQKLMTADVFSYTSYGKEWQYPGLWVQVFMYLIYDWFGPGGLNLWVSFSIVLIFWVVWKTTNGNLLFRSVILILAAISSSIYWAARPYLVTYFLFAVYFYLLEQFMTKGKKLWLIPPLMILWVNSHGGFLAGFLLFVPYIVDVVYEVIVEKKGDTGDGDNLTENGAKLKHLLAIFGLTFAASFLSPQGAKLWTLPFSTVSRQAEQLFIAEWQSPDFHNNYLIPFALMIFLVMYVLGRSNKKAPNYTLLALGGFGLLGLISIRNIFFFAIIAPAAVTAYGTDELENISQSLKFNLKLDFEKRANGFGKIMNYFLIGLVGFVCILRIVIYIPTNINTSNLAQIFPIEAVQYIKSRPGKLPGQMFNAYNFGGYLIWALPNHPVYVDGRADLHEDEIILTWYEVWKGEPEWKSELQKWDVGFVLLEPNAPLLEKLKNAGWREIYRDEVAVIAVDPNKNPN
ncbi:MAG: hypothetical protein P8046_01150 [Anaerolineales bacterium]